jgi:hypothetical protein
MLVVVIFLGNKVSFVKSVRTSQVIDPHGGGRGKTKMGYPLNNWASVSQPHRYIQQRNYFKIYIHFFINYSVHGVNR